MFRFLFVIVAGGDEWKLIAEKLGMTPSEILFLDRRVMNPAEATLSFIASQRYLTVGELYQVLCDSEVPVLADIL